MAVPGPTTFGADEFGESLLRLGTWSGVGFVVGALSAFGIYELYPPARSQLWTIPALAAAVLIVMVALYGIAVWLGEARAADWLVLGFTIALVLATGLVVARELLTLIRDELPAVVWFDALRTRVL